tara:strand:+ start:727 stop:984 length:258 start_codon:yes stop_codon:yes gene_type:complete
MGFIFGGGGSPDPEPTTSDPQESVIKQEQKVQRQELQEKKKFRARKSALRKGGTMSQLVSQERTSPMLGNPNMPEEQMKLGRNPR